MIGYKPIGIIHSPFKKIIGTPIQPKAAEGIKGKIEIFEEYGEGLEGIEEFSHIILIYHFHMVKEVKLKVKPYMGESNIGVFATRAPARPNPIGMSVVEVVERRGRFIRIRNIDVIDGTPLLDIKPYVPAFDGYMKETKIGWLENNIHKLKKAKDDGRFI